MGVSVIKYNAGNVFSVMSSLRRLGVEAEITDDPDVLMNSEKVIFPGVGEASSAMEYLRSKGLDSVIRSIRNPLLGICIGQQLLCRHSQEGDTDCLGIFDVDVLKFKSEKNSDKIPHTGWNTIGITSQNGIIPSALDGRWVYYVHSYYVPVCRYTTAVTDYITSFSAAIRRDNYFATQFHPEKSGEVGEIILKRFLEL